MPILKIIDGSVFPASAKAEARCLSYVETLELIGNKDSSFGFGIKVVSRFAIFSSVRLCCSSVLFSPIVATEECDVLSSGIRPGPEEKRWYTC